MSKLITSKGKCERCGKIDGEFDNAHVIGRRNLALRWDILNLLCLCRGCHQWGHANPEKFILWFSAKFPERWLYLEAVRNNLARWRQDDYELMLENMKSRQLGNMVLWR